VADGFVSLASIVGESPASALRQPVTDARPAVVEFVAPTAEPPSDPPARIVWAAAPVLEEIARMRLAAREAFERNTARLLAALADDVLARELRLADCDLAALAARVLAAAGAAEPVVLVVG